MEKLIEMIAKVQIESKSAVEIIKWLVTARAISTVLGILAAFGGIGFVIHQIYRIFDRITIKKK